MQYSKAKMTLNGKAKKRLGHETYLETRSDGSIAVRYHNTDVVTINPDGTYELRAGVWFTPTTKKRINQYSPARVYQQNFDWYIWTPQGPVEFKNNIRVDESGNVCKEAVNV